MLRYKTETRPGLVALYDIRPGNGAGQFLQPRSPHGAGTEIRLFIERMPFFPPNQHQSITCTNLQRNTTQTDRQNVNVNMGLYSTQTLSNYLAVGLRRCTVLIVLNQKCFQQQAGAARHTRMSYTHHSTFWRYLRGLPTWTVTAFLHNSWIIEMTFLSVTAATELAVW